MDEAEFDKVADEYYALHANNIRISGETPDFFARYKVADAAALTGEGQDGAALEILDFGAGLGASVPHFQEFFPRARVTCADVSRKCLAIGAQRFGDLAHFVHFDGRTLPTSDGTFDLVFVACVLHHISHEEHKAILSELRRVLRPRGSLIVFEHNPYNPLTVRAVNTCAFDQNARLLRPGWLRDACLATGYRSVRLRYRIFFPHALRALRACERWLNWLPLGAQFSVHAHNQ